MSAQKCDSRQSEGGEVERRGHDELAETRPFRQQGGLHGTFSVLFRAAYLDSILRRTCA